MNETCRLKLKVIWGKKTYKMIHLSAAPDVQQHKALTTYLGIKVCKLY